MFFIRIHLIYYFLVYYLKIFFILIFLNILLLVFIITLNLLNDEVLKLSVGIKYNILKMLGRKI